MAPARLSLAEQIAQLEEPAPVDFDIEDVQISGVDPENTIATELAPAREHYIDVERSKLRKLHDSISDPRYDGVRTSRKQLMEDSDQQSEEESSEDVEVNGLSEGETSEGSGPITSEHHSNDEYSSDHDNEAKDMEQQQVSTIMKSTPVQPQIEQDPASVVHKREEDRKKGKAVSKQISMWDFLLDVRIQLQKMATTSNRLPEPSYSHDFVQDEECRESLTRMLQQAVSLSDKLFHLQESLIKTNDVVSLPPRKRCKFDTSQDVNDYENMLQDASEHVSIVEHVLHPYLLQTLSKWSSKVQAVAPSVLLPSNRNSFSSKGQHLKSAVQLIEETLGDQPKLLARTQVRRGKGARVGVEDTPEKDQSQEVVDTEVFDDADFYRQLLRDVIDAQGNNIGGGDDWMMLQKQKKAKKKVDTKASKGRKLRYEVHEKLQNFMVPVPVQGVWHEEQIDELFASLLGKGYEEIQGTGGVDNSDTVDVTQDDVLKGGFKVFG